MHPAQWLRVAGLAFGGTQADDLIGQDWPASRLLLGHLIARVAFEPGHKADGALVQLVKPGIIQVGPVKDQEIARLKAQVLDGLEVMGFAVRDQDTLGQQAGEDGMQLNGPLADPKLGPGKHRRAQVNGGGIDDFDRRGLLRQWRQLGGDPLIQPIIGLFENDGRALLIGVGQGGTL